MFFILCWKIVKKIYTLCGVFCVCVIKKEPILCISLFFDGLFFCVVLDRILLNVDKAKGDNHSMKNRGTTQAHAGVSLIELIVAMFYTAHTLDR